MAITIDRTNSTLQIPLPYARDIGHWVMLERQNITSSVANVDFDVSGWTAYDILKIEFNNVTVVNDAVNLGMLESVNGGSTYASSYKNHVVRSDHISGATSAMLEGYNATRGTIEMLTSLGNDSFAQAHGRITIFNWQDTANDHNFAFEGHGFQSGGHAGPAFTNSSINPTDDATDYRIQAGSGNLDGGEFTLWGRKLIV